MTPGQTNVLVTGGAGFIGSHVTDHLITNGYNVCVYDALVPQVHDGPPGYLNPDADFVKANLLDSEPLRESLRWADVVSHHASAVGVSQSMYEIENYVNANARGTAALLDIIAKDDAVSLKKMIVSGSMVVYGESTGYCPSCEVESHPELRSDEQLSRGDWEPHCPDCGTTLERRPTAETAPVNPSTVYAQTKKSQEELCLIAGGTYDFPVVGLRYFNVFGPRQSLDNPYTGVCAIFSSRIKNGRPPEVYEDGGMTRDFIYVSDVAEINRRAIERDGLGGKIINVGSGQPVTIEQVASALIDLLGESETLKPKVTGEYRKGDIRHSWADISRMQTLLDYEPQVDFRQGLKQLVDWSRKQSASDATDRAREELKDHDLIE